MQKYATTIEMQEVKPWLKPGRSLEKFYIRAEHRLLEQLK